MKKLLTLTITGIMALSVIVACAPKEANVDDIPTTLEETQKPEETGSSKPEIAVSPVEPEGGEELGQDAPTPKFAIYDGATYLLTDNKTVAEELVGEKLGDTSGYLDFANGNIDESLLSTDYANSLAENAVFYKMSGYNEDFRLIVEADGEYYLLERTESVSEGTAAEYIKALDYTDNIVGATVFNISKTAEYKEFTKEDVVKLLEIFADTTPASLTNPDYEAAAQAQSEGKAYIMSLNFEDGTHTDFVVIPEMNLVSIAETYFTAESLQSDVAFAFDNLPQEEETIVY